PASAALDRAPSRGGHRARLAHRLPPRGEAPPGHGQRAPPRSRRRAMSLLVQRSDVGEFRRRYKWMVLCVILTFSLLIVRLFQLQLVENEDYDAEARHNIIREIRLATTRNMIRDTQKRILTASRPSYNVYVVPSQLDMKDT